MYVLTSAEMAKLRELRSLINGEIDPTDAVYWLGTAGLFQGQYWRAYDYLASIQVDSGQLKSGAEDSTYIWLRGASAVNRGQGEFSDFIRAYTAVQYQLRTGRTLDESGLQQASNDIVQAVIGDVLANGRIPTLAALGDRDAGSVIGALYGSGDDFSAWAGCQLFLLLGNDEFFRQHIIDQNNGTYDLLSLIISAGQALGLAFPTDPLQFGLALGNLFLTSGTNNIGFVATYGLSESAFIDAATFYSNHYATFDGNLLMSYFPQVGRMSDEEDFIDGTSDGDAIHAGKGDDTVFGSIDSDVLDGGENAIVTTGHSLGGALAGSRDALRQ